MRWCVLNFSRNVWVMLPLVLAGASSAQADDMATSMCRSYINGLVPNWIGWRNSGVPIAQAEGPVNSISDVNLRMFMRNALKETYRDPLKAEKEMNNGKTLQSCASKVRGY
jgi:hypothetical protein